MKLNVYKSSDSTIWPIDGTLTDTTTPSQSWPKSKDNEKLHHIPQHSRTEAAPSDPV